MNLRSVMALSRRSRPQDGNDALSAAKRQAESC
jgi:hypothetical protein